MFTQVLLNSRQISLIIDRLCFQLIENHLDFSDTVLIGVQPRGICLSDRIYTRLRKIKKDAVIEYGKLDTSFYRDDFRRTKHPITPAKTEIDFSIEGKNVVLVDDVLYTGRTIRAAMDALLDFGRPEKVELLVLIDRRFTRQLPIQADYIGRAIDSIASEKVKVKWMENDGEDVVDLLTEKRK